MRTGSRKKQRKKTSKKIWWFKKETLVLRPLSATIVIVGKLVATRVVVIPMSIGKKVMTKDFESMI